VTNTDDLRKLAADMRQTVDRLDAGELTATDMRSFLARWHTRLCTCDESCCSKHGTHSSPHVGCVLR